ncbi:unnamed protein product [Ranitomeya imitator]|uniref:Uncharacterized protein n=1 Tax=Ranitomeya imitator TaxID=111125 RepID=A0ABN9LBV6_9NEOB|nr:unnamed protein product [Ranitomeya imitator]
MPALVQAHLKFANDHVDDSEKALEKVGTMIRLTAFVPASRRLILPKQSTKIQLNNEAQYNAWKGQLYIHEQLVCDISLQTPSSCSIPAQLPEKLDVREVIQLSELRKKLPEDIFQKTDFTGQEVFCENVYYSSYPVVTANIVESELDKVLKYLKDQDLPPGAAPSSRRRSALTVQVRWRDDAYSVRGALCLISQCGETKGPDAEELQAREPPFALMTALHTLDILDELQEVVIGYCFHFTDVSCQV